MLGMRKVVNVHLSRERFDVLVAVLLPLILMAESGYANAWVFAAGHLGVDTNSVIALFRGFFLEALIFACFKLVKVFFVKGKWVVAVIPGLVGAVGMIVSAGCNLGWMTQSPEMVSALHQVGYYLPAWMSTTFRVGLGLLFPVAVGVFALFDVRHLIEEALNSSHLDHQALLVNRAEQHRTAYLKAQQKQIKAASQAYDDICAMDAQNMVSKVRGGDLSFGSTEITQVRPVPSSVTRINAPLSGRSLPVGTGSAFLPHQPTIQGQFGPTGPLSSTTQNIQVPPPTHSGGFFGTLFGGR